MHGRYRQHLQQMVLEKIARDAAPIVVGPSILDEEHLPGDHMDLCYPLAVPIVTLGEPVFHHLADEILAQIMVDTIDLVFQKDMLEAQVERYGGLQIMPERFFYHDPGVGCIQFLTRQTLRDRHKVFWSQTEMVSDLLFQCADRYELLPKGREVAVFYIQSNIGDRFGIVQEIGIGGQEIPEIIP